MKNREGFVDFDWPDDLSKDRKPGLSGFVRLRDEETWCGLAIESFLPWVDELVIAVQPSADNTRIVVADYDKQAKIYDYPFLTKPNGPGHDGLPEDSVHTPSYYYNFALSKTTRTHVVKLDGDIVMMDWAGEVIRNALEHHDRIKFSGVDIVGDELRHVGSHPHCSTDGVFKVEPGVRYRPGASSEKLVGIPQPTRTIRMPVFLHFKFARKSESSVTKAWPENWADSEHFQRIWERRLPVADYKGPYPESIKALL